MGRMWNRLLAKIFTRFPSLASRWARTMEADRAPIPWALPRVALREARVALVTTGGVHLRSQPPFDMRDPDGDPTFREIPTGAPREELTITHDYYDHADADRDLNLVLPRDRLRELVEHTAVGALHSPAYAFMGHIDGRHVEALVRRHAPEVARRLRNGGVHYALLVPA